MPDRARTRRPTRSSRRWSVILVAMWVGSGVSASVHVRSGSRLPAYIGAMLVAAVIRNVDDATGLSRAVAADDRRSRERRAVAVPGAGADDAAAVGAARPGAADAGDPLVQVALMAAVALAVTFRLMGRDYDAAVMGGGLCGFMLGTTANAMANMEALVDRYGPAPRAFLVVPMVGAFFIDFTTRVIITAYIYLNALRWT